VLDVRRARRQTKTDITAGYADVLQSTAGATGQSEAPPTAPPAKKRRRRLSPVRVFVAVGVLGALGAAGFTMVGQAVDALASGSGDTWYASYVDATLTPEYHFEDPGDNPASQVVLGFVVADATGSCSPSWGTHFTLDEAATKLDLDRRVARVRQRSADVIVSFGGAINNELALRCTDTNDLVQAYSKVIDRYDLTTVDFDIEATALQDEAANTRRAAAVAQLQDEARKAGRELAVWVTLPVAPDGMPASAVAVVDSMLAAKVDLAGVNIMTMDYGASRGSYNMIDATTRALQATWRQVDASYRRAGLPLAASDVWKKVGATPMIGQNDAPEERFTLEDAQRLARFATERGLGRVSMWSANRDGPCGAQWDSRLVSNTCSGVPQEAGEFAQTFAGFKGKAMASATARTVADTTPPVADNPATSPYPVWRTQRVYEAGSKVVWHGNVYEAKWWTQGNLPDEPVVNVWDTAWRYIGPVLPTDKPRPSSEVMPADLLAWSADTVYQQGDKVLYNGAGYEAKWWTRGDKPNDDPDRPWDTPWQAIEES
jgi:chitinase